MRRSVCVLIITDDALVAAQLVGRLQGLGFHVIGAVSSEEEAMKLVELNHPDLVLADIRLGGCLEAIEMGKRLQSHAPVVFIAEQPDQETLKKAGLRGPFGYILKPFDQRDIMTQLEMALYKREVEQNVLASQRRYRAVSAKLEQLIAERTQELAKESAAREEAEILLDVAGTLGVEQNIEKLVQKVTDAGTALTRAHFGAFFYNAVNEQGESYVLYTLSGAPREAFSKFGLPRNTPLFESTFRGEDVLRIDDVLYDKRYGKNPPHHGMPKGHLPVRSYLAVPVISRSGKVLGGLFFGHPQPAMFTDRAERLAIGIAAHAAVALDNARLIAERQESERRIREVIDALPAAVYTTDASGHLTHFNRAAIELSGRVPKTGEDKWCVTCKLYNADGRLLRDEEGPVALTLQEKRIDQGHEMIAERPDGTRIWVASYPTLLRDAGGGVIGAINMLVDVTERKRAEDALRHSEERLQALTSDLEHLVDERTTELLESQKHLRALATELNLAEQRERQRIATDLHDHLQQLLVLGKIRLGQAKSLAEPIPAWANINKQVDEILSDALSYTRSLVAQLCPPVLREFGLAAALKWLGEQMEQHQLEVSVTIAIDDFTIPEEDSVLLFQSVRELLMNAVKHAGTSKVAVHVMRDNEELRIEVQDSGVGFELNALRGRANTQSSKFGLFSIGERMKALGGMFEIDSAPGKGTMARLILPLAENARLLEKSTLSSKTSAGNIGQMQNGMKRDGLVSKSKSISVLLADDHAMMREGLRSVLEAHKDVVVVGEAADGEEAIAMVLQLQPAVVVMDINMPKVNGIDATAYIKSRHPTAKVIGLSVNSGPENQAAMLQAGADMLLTKEMAVEELHRAIQRVLPHAESRGANESKG